MRNGGGDNDRFVVAEHDGSPKWNSHVAKSSAQIHDLLTAGAGSNGFRTMRGRFHGVLLFRVPIDRGLIEKV